MQGFHFHHPLSRGKGVGCVGIVAVVCSLISGLAFQVVLFLRRKCSCVSGFPFNRFIMITTVVGEAYEVW